MTRTRNMLLIAAALTLVISACGKNTTGSSSTPADANAFVLREWSVTGPTAGLHAGKISITATNNGRETHELVIVRARDAASLPTKSDGSVDEARISEADKAGEITDLAAGKSATKTLDLPAGNYIAFCNLVDQMAWATAPWATAAWDTATITSAWSPSSWSPERSSPFPFRGRSKPAQLSAEVVDWRHRFSSGGAGPWPRTGTAT
ncbi:MAG: hypothetical protein M3083_20335 [Actinomycetota bacterium]|nr:hypothetical protein [Actinomycetota bacterium]